jgi:DNA repair protein RadD
MSHSKIQLRYYQEEAVQAPFDYFRTHKGNPIVAMPTGTGKSVVIGETIRRVFTGYAGQRILKVTHRKELIEQNYQKLLNLWPTAPAGIYSAGLGRKEIRPITYAGIGSIAKKAAELGKINLVFVDECHTIGPKDDTNYGNLFADLRAINPLIKIIGYTATPFRLGQGRLTDASLDKEGNIKMPLFNHICYDLTNMEAFNRLVAEGYLARLVPRRTYSEIDVSAVHIVGGEFDQSELQAATDKDAVTKKACDEICYFGADRRSWLIFATGIKHAGHVADELKSRGIDAHCVDSKMDSTVRDDLIAKFKAGKIRCLVNNDILTTGLDVPQIDMIAVLRATMSAALWVQILGRGTRPCTGKNDCLVLDFAGNTKRLGPINDPVMPRRKGAKGEGGVAPVKVCEACGVYNHASVAVCTHCGAEFPKAVKVQMSASAMELMRDSLPKIEIFPVTNVTYSVHTPRDHRPPSLKVSYFSGLRMFSEWVCFEHTGFPLHKAHDWWRERTGGNEDFPATAEEAKERMDEVDTPTHIRVWVNKQMPEVKDHDFSGTGFNTLKTGQDKISLTPSA